MAYMSQHGFTFTTVSSIYTRHFWYSLTVCELKSELTELPRFLCEPGFGNSFPFLFSSDLSPLLSALLSVGHLAGSAFFQSAMQCTPLPFTPDASAENSLSHPLALSAFKSRSLGRRLCHQAPPSILSFIWGRGSATEHIWRLEGNS